ncbi:MAG: RIP metalloprotease RseP [Gammaproteobacteria bacterium]|nr:RIP metalloprotease RseP [Gammaproteobacteria bacterium]MBU1647489.1 RIP metalloprotease RseP [Gammaproteobacteria bacterium]MBU1972938.1 RIP metalloprotease RseP [Gammaproteobacteria bacterium]
MGENLLSTLGAFALALAALIVVHEYGHYLVARLCGVKVLRFSVGFGRPLLTWRAGPEQTEWVLAAFPLGGYVKMLDEREGEVPAADAHRSFNRQSLGRRSLIVAAGPAANFVLAIVLYWFLFMQGVPELRAVVAEPPAATVAAQAGLTEGELIRVVSGKPVATWAEVRWEAMHLALDGRPLELEVINPRGEIAFRSIPTAMLQPTELEGDVLRPLGIGLFRPLLKPIIGSIVADGPAARAGVRVGDMIMAVDGKPVRDWSEMAALIRQVTLRALDLEVLRDGRRETVQVTPLVVEEQGRRIGRVGIGVKDDPAAYDAMRTVVAYGPIESATRALRLTWETSALTLRMMGRMLTGELSWKNISGPVTIADYAGQSARMGSDHFLRFLALISISLGVLNLLPVPVLDGGHLLYYFAELVKGGPLSERAMEIGQQIGLSLLFLLMAFALYNDINRLVSG